MNNDIETQRALEFMRSMRGQYIISQALCLAIKYFKTLPQIQQEPSNMRDMEYLIEKIFPIYRMIENTEPEFERLRDQLLQDHISSQSKAG